MTPKPTRGASSRTRGEWITWHEKKLRRSKAFGSGAPLYAIRMLANLIRLKSVRGTSIGDISIKLSVPPKFGARGIALLTSSGLVHLNRTDGVRVTLQPKALRRSKNKAQKTRTPATKSERARLFAAERFRCAMCGRRFPAHELRIDHLIPLSRLGADEPGNWVALCGPDNSAAWDDFAEKRESISRYRGQRVRQPVGVRFLRGYFWPMIDGQVRTETRKQWGATKESLGAHAG